MERAYEYNETREFAVKQDFIPIISPKRNRKEPWDYDKELYKRRNEVEQYFQEKSRYRLFDCIVIFVNNVKSPFSRKLLLLCRDFRLLSPASANMSERSRQHLRKHEQGLCLSLSEK